MDIKLNTHFLDVKETYLFSDIAKRVRKFQEDNPGREIIRMGIGDVTLPLPESVTSAMEAAVREMADKDTFHGYPPEYGYDFLRNAISDHYKDLGVTVAPETVYVSDGAKSDLGNLPDVLGNNPVIIPDPVYPVYVDSNLMNGRKVSFVEGSKDNDFLPGPGAGFHQVKHGDIVGVIPEPDILNIDKKDVKLIHIALAKSVASTIKGDYLHPCLLVHCASDFFSRVSGPTEPVFGRKDSPDRYSFVNQDINKVRPIARLCHFISDNPCMVAEHGDSFPIN